MFKHNDEKAPITFTSEDLAVPEVHVGHKPKETQQDAPKSEVLYDNVAVPEIRPSFDSHDDQV